MKERHLDLYMRMASEVAKTSTAVNLKVGVVVVKDHRVISIGYNGTPPGYSNVCEHEGVTIPEVIHAEQNAIFKMARDAGGGDGATLFVTHSPCMECAKAIVTSGIKTVYYGTEYKRKDGIYFLQRLGVSVIKFEVSE